MPTTPPTIHVLTGQRMVAPRQFWKAPVGVLISIRPVGAMILVTAICRVSMVANTGHDPSGCALINSSVATCVQVVQARFG